MVILDKENKDFEFCDEYFLYLIDNHIKFDEEDIEMFLECNELENERIYGELDSWDRAVTSICEVGNRFFKIIWFQSLTKYQENYYGKFQSIEVELYTYEKTIIVKDWKEK